MPPVWVLLLLALLLVWLYVRRRQARTPAPPKSLSRSRHGNKDTAYHAIAIKFEPNACDAAKALAGSRFLAVSAPKLPLAECDAAECCCRFQHYDDRRSGNDRRTPFGSGGKAASGSYEGERRHGPDRRHDDDDLEDYLSPRG